jgi:hypothetical protein
MKPLGYRVRALRNHWEGTCVSYEDAQNPAVDVTASTVLSLRQVRVSARFAAPRSADEDARDGSADAHRRKGNRSRPDEGGQMTPVRFAS